MQSLAGLPPGRAVEREGELTTFARATRRAAAGRGAVLAVTGSAGAGRAGAGGGGASAAGGAGAVWTACGAWAADPHAVVDGNAARAASSGSQECLSIRRSAKGAAPRGSRGQSAALDATPTL